MMNWKEQWWDGHHQSVWPNLLVGSIKHSSMHNSTIISILILISRINFFYKVLLVRDRIRIIGILITTRATHPITNLAHLSTSNGCMHTQTPRNKVNSGLVMVHLVPENLRQSLQASAYWQSLWCKGHHTYWLLATCPNYYWRVLLCCLGQKCGKVAKGMLLHHDNATVHTWWHAFDAVKHDRFIVLLHPPYSPHLAPGNYCLLPDLKKRTAWTPHMVWWWLPDFQSVNIWMVIMWRKKLHVI